MARNDPFYKLVYFDMRGLAEPCRMIFAYSAVGFEDVRIKMENWPAMKNKTPFHSLPYLEVDGEIIGQSNAIARFLAQRFNLVGRGDLESARIDALVDYVSDARNGLRDWFGEKDETKKAALKAKYVDEVLPEYLQVFEQHLKSNEGGQGFFVGSNVSWCDFSIACFSHTVQSLLQPGSLDKTPLLKEHCVRIHNLKGVSDWVFKRPKSVI